MFIIVGFLFFSSRSYTSQIFPLIATSHNNSSECVFLWFQRRDGRFSGWLSFDGFVCTTQYASFILNSTPWSVVRENKKLAILLRKLFGDRSGKCMKKVLRIYVYLMVVDYITFFTSPKHSMLRQVDLGELVPGEIKNTTPWHYALRHEIIIACTYIT